MPKVRFKPRRRSTWDDGHHRPTHIHVSWKHDPVYLHHDVVGFKYFSRKRAKRIEQEKSHCRTLKAIAIGRGFSDVSYNAIAFPSGRVYILRGEQVLGAHTLGHNDDPAIVLPGNYNERKVTRRQKLAVRRTLRYWHRRYGIQRRLVPHSAVYSTSCPGANARKAFKLGG